MSDLGKLEQVLEHLLAEDTERAEELLHEYIVETARVQYERLLDETNEEEIDEVVDRGDEEEDLVSELQDDEDDVEEDMFGEDEEEDDMPMDMDDSEGEESEEGEEGEELEDKVDELEDELEQLRREFEELMADEEGEEDEGDMDMDMDMDMEDDMEESIELEIDEADDLEEDEDDVVEEATKLSDKVGDQPMTGKSLKGSEADSTESPFTKAPKPTHVKNGNTGPIKAKDGSDGNRGTGSVKDHTPEDNIDVESKKA